MPRKVSTADFVPLSQPSATDPMMPRLVTIKQAAAYCSCPVWAVRQVIWSKELHACKIGKRLN